MTIIGHTIRWKQRGNDGETTGKRVYDLLDDVTALCERVKTRWKGEITQWSVEWELNEKGRRVKELQDMRSGI